MCRCGEEPIWNSYWHSWNFLTSLLLELQSFIPDASSKLSSFLIHLVKWKYIKKSAKTIVSHAFNSYTLNTASICLIFFFVELWRKTYGTYTDLPNCSDFITFYDTVTQFLGIFFQWYLLIFNFPSFEKNIGNRIWSKNTTIKYVFKLTFPIMT